MHFGLIIGSNQFGGAENQMNLLARGLMAAGHKATVIFADYPTCGLRKRRSSVLDFSGIPQLKLCVRRGFNYFYYPWGKFEIRRRGIDILIANGAGCAYAGYRLAGRSGPPLVPRIAGLQFLDIEREREVMKIAMAHSSWVISNAQVAIDMVKKRNILPPNKPTGVIRNGVITPEVVSSPCAGRFHVIFVGRLAHVKDPMTLLEALKIAKKDLPELTAEFVGDGILYDDMKKYIADNLLGDFIKLSGFIPARQIPYQFADLLVNSSVSELSSGAIAEALYRGVPIVASDVGGNPELIANQEFGAIFPVGNSMALARKIVEFGQKNTAERCRLGALAAEYAETLFSLDNYVKNYIKLAQDILLRK